MSSDVLSDASAFHTMSSNGAPSACEIERDCMTNGRHTVRRENAELGSCVYSSAVMSAASNSRAGAVQLNVKPQSPVAPL